MFGGSRIKQPRQKESNHIGKSIAYERKLKTFFSEANFLEHTEFLENRLLKMFLKDTLYFNAVFEIFVTTVKKLEMRNLPNFAFSKLFQNI